MKILAALAKRTADGLHLHALIDREDGTPPLVVERYPDGEIRVEQCPAGWPDLAALYISSHEAGGFSAYGDLLPVALLEAARRAG